METDWVRAENKIAELLGLRLTIASGRFWHDHGDAKTNADARFQLITDSKATQKGSFSVNRDFMREMSEKTTMSGKRFALHIEFQQEGKKDQDWVVFGLDDFAELLHDAEHPTLTPEQEKALKFFEELSERIKDDELRAEALAAVEKLRN